MGSRLILRRGDALECLAELAAETGATSVYWSRLCEPGSRARDTRVKSGLTERGLAARSFGGHLLFEPWTVETGTGGFYRVFTPFWKSVRSRDVPTPIPAPTRIPTPQSWPRSEDLKSWNLGRAMDRGAAIVAKHAVVGEAQAKERFVAVRA